jgi:AcrR family transcriptional regulator
MIEAAERLFAERSIDAVSLREVALAAGQRNSTAAQYHFRCREGLVEAIWEHRQRAANQRRLALLAELEESGRGDDVRSLVRVFVAPIAEHVATHRPSWWARFLDQAIGELVLRPVRLADREVLAGLRIAEVRLQRQLGHLSPEARGRRIMWMSMFAIHALANHERALDLGLASPATTPAVAAELVDVLQGVLLAPATTPLLPTA